MRAYGFDSLVLARLGRNYLFTSAELKDLIHISYRDLDTILFLKLEDTVREMEKMCFLIYSALLVLTRTIYAKSDAGKHNV